MGLEELKLFPTCCCGWCCATLIFTVIALPLSFKSMEQGFYALHLDWTTQKISEDVVAEPGMRMVGLGNMLVEYPSTFQTMYFIDASKLPGGWNPEDGEILEPPVLARTSDGLRVTVSLSFQWKLEPDALVPLYHMLGNEAYRHQFVRMARGTIVESCTHFAADSFFTNRTIITALIWEQLSDAWKRPEKGISASIQGVQLREVDLPEEFNAEIIATQEQMQEVDVAIAERDKDKIMMETNQVIAEQEVKELLQGALASAEEVRLQNEAVVNQMIVFQQEQAIANAEVVQSFSQDVAPYDRLFDLMEVRALTSHMDDKMLVSLA
eukprot:gnl/TRDRNA2_/TRDRNA2_174530_c1_seq6.p1 gnl/TRDRNA2_/TRDRNA2_174530_c1~~gnl/TRDRNA2_/TRDRNA2_174530_c1_seq6.p1  ORF type:complete len:324 (+),score=61.13 gnl/TRDRNA2_/TRDRNA2_174530_c1_seq6:117-1088(+)